MSISNRTIFSRSNPVKNDNTIKKPPYTRRLTLRENLDCDIVYHRVVNELFVRILTVVAVEVVRFASDIRVA